MQGDERLDENWGSVFDGVSMGGSLDMGKI